MNLWKFHIMHPVPLTSESLHILPSYPEAVVQTKIKKQQSKQTKTKEKIEQQKQPLRSSFFPPVQYLFVCPGDIGTTLYPFDQITLLVNVHCRESLVWFIAPGTPSSLDPHWNISGISQGLEILGLLFPRTSPFMSSSRS